MRSVLAYTAARLLLFAVAFAVLYLLGARGLLAAAIAVVVSGLLSYVLLSAQRDAMSSTIAGGIARMRGVRARLEAGAAKEDDVQQAGAAEAEGGSNAEGDAVPQDAAEPAERGQQAVRDERPSGEDGGGEEPRSGAPQEAR